MSESVVTPPAIFNRIQSYHQSLLASKVARKYKLLSENPFRFFRGTNHLFYEDLSKTIFPFSPSCWICGDLHLENFGSYKGDNRLVYFDLNDFDESILAPVAWEVARMLTSILVAFDSLKITDEEAAQVCEIFIKKYAEVLAKGKPTYIETRTSTGIIKRFLKSVEERSDKKLMTSRTIEKNGTHVLSDGNSKQLAIDKELKSRLIKAFKSWMKSNNAPPNDYKVLDARFRLAGTGSLGVHRYVFLIEKKSDSQKHMLIDMKQATPSSLALFVKTTQPVWESDAARMVSIQRLMQNVAPAQLSTLDFNSKSFLMQELQPFKDRINFELIQKDFKTLCGVIEKMAMLAASAHLRGVGRLGSCSADDLITFGMDTAWHKPILTYAANYKKQVVSDYKEFKSYLKSKSKNVAEKKNLVRKVS